MIAGGEGGQVGASQRGLDQRVGGTIFCGEGFEPAPEVECQAPYHLQMQRALRVRPAGVCEESCGQDSCLRGITLWGGHRAGFYPKVGLSGLRIAQSLPEPSALGFRQTAFRSC
jgi:hypothetical protein